MHSVEIGCQLWMMTAVAAGVIFLLRTWHRAWHVGLLRYVVTLAIASVAWPIFVGKGYF